MGFDDLLSPPGRTGMAHHHMKLLGSFQAAEHPPCPVSPCCCVYFGATGFKLGRGPHGLRAGG